MTTIELYDKAAELAILLNEQQPHDSFEVTLESDGSVMVEFSHYHHGDTDRWYFGFTTDDLQTDSMQVVAKYRAIEEEKARREEEAKAIQIKAHNERVEKNERVLYERLKTKYEK